MNEVFIKTDKVPKGWVLASLNDFTDIIMGQSPPSDTYNEKKIGLPFFQGKAEFTELNPVVRKWCSAPKKIALPNDVLMSVRAPVGATNIANLECCIGRGLAAIRYSYCNKFLFYFFRLVDKKLDEKGTGTTFRAISGDIIKKSQIYFPPLPEQHRIVAKIEELFSSLDKGVESLKTAQQQLKTYRQAVLKWAFEGKKQIDFDELIRSSQNGISKRKSNVGINFKVLRLADVTQSKIDSLNPRLIKLSSSEIGKNKLIENDLLCIRVNGSKDLVGSLIFVDKMDEANNWAFCDHFIRFVLKEDKAISKFYYYFFKTVGIRKYIHDNMVTSAGQNTVSQGTIKNIRVPIVSIQEQQRAVSEIESRLSVCDKLEESITQSLQQAEALRQSILKKAFEGKLVPQDPDDEPASVLLERIRAEREIVGSRVGVGTGRDLSLRKRGPLKTRRCRNGKTGKRRIMRIGQRTKND